MNQRSPFAGGVFIAIGGIAGALIGRALGQTSIGLLGGLAAGAAMALAIWAGQRR